jgi:hypothetical protein
VDIVIVPDVKRCTHPSTPVLGRLRGHGDAVLDAQGPVIGLGDVGVQIDHGIA